MNFQVTVLKILVSYPDGFAQMADLKRDMAILATSGPDWSDRTKRMAARVPDLDIFSQGLVVRQEGGWRITDKGRAVLVTLEGRPDDPQLALEATTPPSMTPTGPMPPERGERGLRRRERLHRRRAARQRARTNAPKGRPCA